MADQKRELPAGAQTAEGIWAMFDHVEYPAESEGPGSFRGYGHYFESYRKIDGYWRIEKMKLARLRVDRLGDGAVP